MMVETSLRTIGSSVTHLGGLGARGSNRQKVEGLVGVRTDGGEVEDGRDSDYKTFQDASTRTPGL